ncbi:DUF4238 domain-containing protein [Flavobacterium undicola]|uniref:DUF4238 domain-containing protein n=1 Tax=Flavobacterium undicola TaxID=1932779 RepID=UPI00137778E9|nr:DUF4238 domain-containing protein [Flavobacterium undicola]MBA0882460.1 DUF4238 domain-containing protein [Flavobacterium undicola]
MSSESKKHHYIPVFYIKNFCNEKGQIFVNDKSNEKDYENIKIKYPKNIFFEWNRNNFEFDGEKNDAIEKMYGILDNDLVKTIKKVIDDEALPGRGLKVETLRKLIFLGYLIKWRVPKNDPLVNDLKKEITFEDFNLFGTIDQELISVDDLLSDEISQEYKRILFSGALFSNSEKYAKVFKNTFLISFQKPLFATDNPFVELKYSDDNNDYPSFIFPITSNLLLVHCDFIDKKDFGAALVSNEKYDWFIDVLYNSVQITLMWHADKYIGNEDRAVLDYYLKNVMDMSEKLDAANVNSVFYAFYILRNYKTLLT